MIKFNLKILCTGTYECNLFYLYSCKEIAGNKNDSLDISLPEVAIVSNALALSSGL